MCVLLVSLCDGVNTATPSHLVQGQTPRRTRRQASTRPHRQSHPRVQHTTDRHSLTTRPWRCTTCSHDKACSHLATSCHCRRCTVRRGKPACHRPCRTNREDTPEQYWSSSPLDTHTRRRRAASRFESTPFHRPCTRPGQRQRVNHSPLGSTATRPRTAVAAATWSSTGSNTPRHRGQSRPVTSALTRCRTRQEDTVPARRGCSTSRWDKGPGTPGCVTMSWCLARCTTPR